MVYSKDMNVVKVLFVALTLITPVMLKASPAEAGKDSEQLRGTWLKDASEQDILNRISQALGSQDIDITDPNKLMGIAKGLGLIK
jgi:uncharacterized lipoprotein YddW (UPF0748 family)